MRRLALGLGLLLGIVTGGCAASSRPGAVVGKPAPPLSGETVAAGQRVDLAGFRGRPVLVNFWGSWCDPCRRELPRLVAAERAGTAVVGVDVKDSRRAATELLAQVGATWPSAWDPDTAVARRWGLRDAYPVTFAVDAAGVVRGQHVGEMADADVAALVAAASPR